MTDGTGSTALCEYRKILRDAHGRRVVYLEHLAQVHLTAVEAKMTFQLQVLKSRRRFRSGSRARVSNSFGDVFSPDAVHSCVGNLSSATSSGDQPFQGNAVCLTIGFGDKTQLLCAARFCRPRGTTFEV